MSNEGKLYFWANGMENVPDFDHTWVTSYPFVNGQYATSKDIPAGGSYWYCWGCYHPSGDGGVDHNPNGAIGQADADLDLARRLVEANVAPPKPPIGSTTDPQDGSITFYAVDGVCHNVANQVLFATGSSSVEPQRVIEARAYHLSTFFYTNYGLNNSGWEALRQREAPSIKVPGDDFMAWFEATLGDNVSAGQVLAVKTARNLAQVALQELHGKVQGMTADEVWAAVGTILLTALLAVRKVLGDADFLALFPSLPRVPAIAEEALAWLDRDLLDRSVAHMHYRAGKT